MTIKKAIGVWVVISLILVLVGSYVVFGTKTKINNLILRGNNLFLSLIREVPSDLEVKVQNGEVVINKERPYCLRWRGDSGMGIFFDKGNSPILADDPICPVWVTIGENYMKIKDSEGQYKIYEVNKNDNYTINRKKIEQFYGVASPKIETGLWLTYYVAPWLIWFLVFSWGLIVCFWYSWWVKLALRIFMGRKDLEWEEIYGVVLFLMSGWYLFKYGVMWLMVNNFWGQNMSRNFPLINTLVLVILALIWYSKIKIQWWKKN